MNILEKIDIFLNEAMNMNTASTLYQNIGFILNSSNIDKKSKEKALKLKQDFERNQEISKSDEKWVFKMYRKLKNI